MSALRAGTQVSTSGEQKDEEEEGGGDEHTGRERRAPPAYDELSSHFGVLEAAAEESGNRDVAFYLTKAKMAMIPARSAKRVRQADMRECLSRRSEGGGTVHDCFLRCASFRVSVYVLSVFNLQHRRRATRTEV